MKLGNACDAFNPYLSHPSRGAWIEIPSSGASARRGVCRTPHGVRGLKFAAHERHAFAAVVAPLTGCVD